MTEDWAKVKSIYIEAISLPESERLEFLRRSCRDEAEYDAVRSLLSETGKGQVDDGLDAFGRVFEQLAQKPQGSIPTRIGAYRIRQRLGQGGMSTAYLAEHADSGHEVVLKVSNRRWQSDASRAEFDNEARVLARLQDERIARLFWDAEQSKDQPHIAIEYVDGLPIDRYCDERQLEIHARLRLFLQVCEGVRGVHEKNIVHADLKPSNILVNKDGQVKLIDFGIARFRETTGEIHQNGQVVATRAYASPEQLAGNSIDTQTDVFSLGIILYELLTGLHPFEDQESKVENDRHGVTAKAPSRSVRAVGTKQSALLRGFRSPRRLARSLKGALDAIAMVALKINRRDRYRSIRQLASDIESYIDGKRVSVSRSTLRQSLMEHKPATSAALGVIVLVIAAMAYQQYRILKIEAERERSKAVAYFLTDVLRPNDKIAFVNGDVSAYDQLKGAPNQLYVLDGHPETQAEVMLALGSTFFEVGDVQTADELLGGALALLEKGPADKRSVGVAASWLAQVRMQQGWIHEAELLAKKGLEMAERSGDRGTITFSLGVYAEVLHGNSDLEGAGVLVDRLLTMELDEGRVLKDSLLLFASSHYSARGDFDRAEEILTELIHRQEKCPNDQGHPSLWESWHSLGTLHRLRGDCSRARRAFDRAEIELGKHFEPGHLYQGGVLLDRGRCDFAEGQFDSALEFFQQAIEIARDSGGDQVDELVGGVLIEVGDVHYQRGDRSQLRVVGQELIDAGLKTGNQRLGGHGHLCVARSSMLAFDRTQLESNLIGASESLHQGLQELEIHYGSDHPDMVRALWAIGTASKILGEKEKARGFFVRVLQIAKMWPNSVDAWYSQSAKEEIENL